MKRKQYVIGIIGSAVIGTLVIGLIIKSEFAVASEPPPYVGELAETDEVQKMNSQSPEELLRMAREKLAENALREAALINTAYLMSHPTQEGFELYVEIYQAQSDKYHDEEDFAAATLSLSEAMNALEHWKSHMLEEGMDEQEVSKVFTLEDQIKEHSGQMAIDIIEKAEKLRESVRRWWWRDDRGPIIEALVLLDAIEPDLLPRQVRHRHSKIWSEYYGLLGNSEIEKYKVRSNLENN